MYDAQAQTLNVYLNGQLNNGTLAGTVTPSQLDALINVNIGQRPSLGGYKFSGTIDDVRIYNRALSQVEIQADMAVPASAPPPDTTPPTAPSVLSATAASASQINLSWTASTDNVGVTGYRVERCQGAGCSTFAQIATPVATTFSDAGLVGSTSYSYRVRAADIAGNLSGYSNVASATTASAQGQMYFIHPDHLNTPRLIANQAGNTAWRNDNTEPFGDSVPNGNPSGLGAFDFPLRFPGQYFDRETNLAYNYFRDYDPTTGRYIQSDPIGLRGGLNTYRYVKGLPLAYIDPSGLGTLGTVGEIMIPIGALVTVSGAATGLGPVVGVGVGIMVVGGALVLVDVVIEAEHAQNFVDPIRQRKQNEQNEIDKIFPPPPSTPAQPASSCQG